METNKPTKIILPNEQPPNEQPTAAKFDVSEIASILGELYFNAMENQSKTNLKIAEINKPISQKQLEIQQLQITNQHEAWTKSADAQISKDKREFTTQSLILGLILLFLMAVAFILLFKSEYNLALSIITLLIGFISGYSINKVSKNQSNEQS